jgi:hypothetical protein
MALGIEVYATSPAELESLLTLKPDPATPVMVHLPRHYDLRLAEVRQAMEEFIVPFAGRVHGWVVHDQADIPDHFEDYIRSLTALNVRLHEMQPAPRVFLEYASGLDPSCYIDLFVTCRALRHISACIDIGHLGLFQTRRAFALEHAGEDVCDKRSTKPLTMARLEDVQSAVATALPVTLHVIQALSGLGKPLHYHLHDGHPLSRWSRYGLSDHLSFTQPVPLDGPARGASAHLMFGPEGLDAVVEAAVKGLPADLLSFTLELHETEQRLPLREADSLFSHWRDKTHAEQINHWLAMVAENRQRLSASLQDVLRKVRPPEADLETMEPLNPS